MPWPTSISIPRGASQGSCGAGLIGYQFSVISHTINPGVVPHGRHDIQRAYAPLDDVPVGHDFKCAHILFYVLPGQLDRLIIFFDIDRVRGVDFGL